MVALQIRNVPPGIRDALAEEARRRGQSLQAYLLHIVEAEVARTATVDLVTAVVDLGGGLTEGGPTAAEALAAARDERDEALAATRP